MHGNVRKIPLSGNTMLAVEVLDSQSIELSVKSVIVPNVSVCLSITAARRLAGALLEATDEAAKSD